MSNFKIRLVVAGCGLLVSQSLFAQAPAPDTIDKLMKEFTPSTLSKEQQRKEFEWFREAAKPFKGKDIMVVSETIDTHKYESEVIAKAFTELTGIHVVHELTGEDDVVKKIETQVRTGIHLYDAYIND